MHRIILILFLVVLASITYAQEATLRVELSADTVRIGNYFELKYTLENANAKFEIPELEGLTVIAGPNTSSSMSMINGKISQSASYSLMLQPLDIGEAFIAPAYFELEEGYLETSPIKITILDNPDGIQERSREMKVLEEIIQDGSGKSKRKKRVKRFKI